MDIDGIKKFFDKDRFARMVGAVVEDAAETGAVCTLTLNENHFNAAGLVQGGAVFTLADFAFAVACNFDDLRAGNDAVTISQSSNILFFRPAKGDKLTATAACLQRGRKISVYRIVVTDTSGLTIAEMTGTACRVVRRSI